MKNVRAIRCEGPPTNLDLSQVLGGSVDLRDGLCVGHWQLFDARQDGEAADAADQRHSRAMAICETACPILAKCSAWLAGLPKRQRPTGVVAGDYIPASGEKKKPRKKAS